MKNNLSKTIGQRLQMIRLQKNLTQEQMGEELNLSTSAYCKIEYGETDLTLTRLYRIAEIMDMSALRLFETLSGESHETSGQEIEDLYERVRSNSRFIEMLCKRIELLERNESVSKK